MAEHEYQLPVVHEIYVPRAALEPDDFIAEFEHEVDGVVLEFGRKALDNVVDLNEYRAKLPMYRRPPNL